MQFSFVLCLAAVLSSAVALPTNPGALSTREEAGYKGAGGVDILNGVEISARDEGEYKGAGGVDILNGVEISARDEGEYKGAGGVDILNGVEISASR